MMRYRAGGTRGFSFLEIIIVLAALGVLTASVAGLNYLRNRQAAEAALCADNRRIIEQAEMMYVSKKSAYSESLQDLVDAGFLTVLPQCPGEGVYAWEPLEAGAVAYQSTLGCSVHTGEASVVTNSTTTTTNTTTNTTVDLGTASSGAASLISGLGCDRRTNTASSAPKTR